MGDEVAKELRYVGVQMEKILHEVKATNEGVAAIRQMLEHKPDREEFDELKADVKTINAAVKATNRELAGHKHEGDLKLMLHAPRRPTN